MSISSRLFLLVIRECCWNQTTRRRPVLMSLLLLPRELWQLIVLSCDIPSYFLSLSRVSKLWHQRALDFENFFCEFRFGCEVLDAVVVGEHLDIFVDSCTTKPWKARLQLLRLFHQVIHRVSLRARLRGPVTKLAPGGCYHECALLRSAAFEGCLARATTYRSLCANCQLPIVAVNPVVSVAILQNQSAWPIWRRRWVTAIHELTFDSDAGEFEKPERVFQNLLLPLAVAGTSVHRLHCLRLQGGFMQAMLDGSPRLWTRSEGGPVALHGTAAKVSPQRLSWQLEVFSPTCQRSPNNAVMGVSHCLFLQRFTARLVSRLPA
jgi:hypothetical protein